MLVVVGFAALFLPISLGRLVDADEGYLLMAARLVSEGNVPYRDFFLTQGPGLPAVYGAFFGVVGHGWLAARLFAAIIAVAIGVLVYRETLAATHRHAAACFAAALFAFCGMTIGWLTIVKGYGLAALFMLAGVHWIGKLARAAKTGEATGSPAWLAFGAGVMMGMSSSTRLYTILVAPALALFVLSRCGFNRQSVRHAGLLAFGCLLGLLPLVACYALDREAFVFDTLLFHRIREYGQSSLLGTPSEKLPLVLMALGFHPGATIENRQLMGLVIVSLLSLTVRIRWRSARPSAAAWVWPGILVASTLPNPFHPQYFCLLVPFLAIEGGRLLSTLLDHPFQGLARYRGSAVAICALAYLAYHLGVGGIQANRYLYTGKGVPGVDSSDRVLRWRIGTVEAVAAEMDSLGIPEGASWWPGYFVSTRTRVPLALANDFGFRAAAALSPEERRHLHVVSLEEVGGMIRRRSPRLFVEGNWAPSPWVATLATNGFRVRTEVRGVRLWVAE